MSLCPDCGTRNSKVLDTRLLTNGWLRRRRLCNQCERRWYTYEIPADSVTITEENDATD
jgi:transcriptional repressor NrdR